MRSLSLATAFLLFSLHWLVAQTAANQSVFFETGKFDLSSEAQSVLAQFAQQLQGAPDYDMVLNAYTDNQGTAEFNEQLANDRAKAVSTFLAKKGVLTQKIAVTSWGERKQVSANNTEDNRAKNRRVDLEAKLYTIDNPAVLMERLRSKAIEPYSTSIPDTNEEQTLTTPAGTVVVVPANAFVDEKGEPVTGRVELKIEEALKPSDWLLNGLSTMSNGKLLQSGGMVKVTATANGRELQLAEDASITVAIPGQGRPIDPDMQLFYGQHDSTGATNWVTPRETQKFRRKLKGAKKLGLPLTPELANEMKKIKAEPLPKPESGWKFTGKQPVAPTEPRIRRAPVTPDWATFSVAYQKGGKLKGKQLKRAKADFAQKQQQYQSDSITYVAAFAVYSNEKLPAYQAKLKTYKEEARQYEFDRANFQKNSAEIRTQYLLHIYSMAFNKVMARYQRPSTKIRVYDLQNKVEDWLSVEANKLIIELQNSSEPSSIFPDAKKLAETTYMTAYGSHHWYYGQTQVDSFANGLKRLFKKSGLTAMSDSIKTEIRFADLAKGQVSGSEMAAYVTDITRLGWINCDKFYKSQEPLVKLEYSNPGAMSMYAYFPELRSMMLLSTAGDGLFSVSGIPANQKVILLSVKTDNGKIFFSRNEIMTGQAPPQYAYLACSMHDFRRELERLN